MNCKHFSGRIGSLTINGQQTTLYACAMFTACIQKMDPSLHYAACDVCEENKPQNHEYLTCAARQEPTGETLVCNCGVDRTIFNCRKFGKCAKRPPPGKTQKDFPGVKFCAECRDPE